MKTREQLIEDVKVADNESLLKSLMWSGAFQMNENEENRRYGEMVEEIVRAEILRRMAQ